MTLQQIFKNHFKKTVLKKFDANTLLSSSYVDKSMVASATFCSISSGGNGEIIPLFFLPRPRAVAIWSASLAVTLVSHFFMPISFLADGAQNGIIIGFIGIGLTWALPGYNTYGFVGYALYTFMSADHIEFFVPN